MVVKIPKNLINPTPYPTPTPYLNHIVLERQGSKNDEHLYFLVSRLKTSDNWNIFQTKIFASVVGLSPTHGYVEISTIFGGLIYLYWYYNNSWLSLVYLYWYYNNSWLSLVYLYWYDKTAGLVSSTCTGTTTTAGTCTCTGRVVKGVGT